MFTSIRKGRTPVQQERTIQFSSEFWDLLSYFDIAPGNQSRLLQNIFAVTEDLFELPRERTSFRRRHLGQQQCVYGKARPGLCLIMSFSRLIFLALRCSHLKTFGRLRRVLSSSARSYTLVPPLAIWMDGRSSVAFTRCAPFLDFRMYFLSLTSGDRKHVPVV